MSNTTIQNSVMGFISAVAILTVILFFNSAIYAQAPDFIWAKQAGGTNWDEGCAIATDGSGNILVTGRFSETATFDTTTLTSSGRWDIFTAKYDVSGNLLWAKRAGGSSGSWPERGTSIATDGSGNSIITGTFYYNATFDTIRLGCGRVLSIFTAKYDPSGNVLWAKCAGGVAYDEGLGIATDEVGNNYVTGYFSHYGATFDTITLNSAGGEDIFIAKYDASGNILWAKQAGGSGDDRGYSIATDGSGNCIVTGSFKGTATFGTITLISAGGSDIFIAKYDTSGNVFWAKRAGGTDDYDYGRGIATDGSGNSIVTGSFKGTATFGTITLTSAGGSDIFIAKYDASGNVLWAKRAGGTDDYDYGQGIATDGSGNSIVTGSFDGTATFDMDTLTSAGDTDIFIAKYDASGNVLWAKRAGGTYPDKGYGIATDGSGNSIVTGSFGGIAYFDTDTLTSAGDRDIFIAKLGSGETNTITVISPNGGENWSVGSSQDITWTSAGSIEDVKIEYSTDNGIGWIEIITSTPNDGEYEWIIPPTPSLDCLVRISDAIDGELFDVSDSTFVIGCKGDVNGDGSVDIFDLVKLINFILDKTEPTDYEFWAGDINDDGVLDIFDVVKIIKIILEGRSLALAKEVSSPAHKAEFSLPDISLTPEQTTEVPLFANFDGTVAGIQLELSYDPQALKVSAPVLTSRTDQMDLASVDKDGKLTVLIYSASGNVIEADSEPIINLRVETLSGFNGSTGLKIDNAIAVNGKAEAISVNFSTGNIAVAKPKSYLLSQNYPNPFNSETTIKFELPENIKVTLKVFNLRGEEVRTLVDQDVTAGYHTVTWDGRDNTGSSVATGIYIYRMKSESFTSFRKMAFLK